MNSFPSTESPFNLNHHQISPNNFSEQDRYPDYNQQNNNFSRKDFNKPRHTFRKTGFVQDSQDEQDSFSNDNQFQNHPYCSYCRDFDNRQENSSQQNISDSQNQNETDQNANQQLNQSSEQKLNPVHEQNHMELEQKGLVKNDQDNRQEIQKSKIEDSHQQKKIQKQELKQIQVIQNNNINNIQKNQRDANQKRKCSLNYLSKESSNILQKLCVKYPNPQITENMKQNLQKIFNEYFYKKKDKNIWVKNFNLRNNIRLDLIVKNNLPIFEKFIVQDKQENAKSSESYYQLKSLKTILKEEGIKDNFNVTEPFEKVLSYLDEQSTSQEKKETISSIKYVVESYQQHKINKNNSGTQHFYQSDMKTLYNQYEEVRISIDYIKLQCDQQSFEDYIQEWINNTKDCKSQVKDVIDCIKMVIKKISKTE